jgi:hypothetical protein
MTNTGISSTSVLKRGRLAQKQGQWAFQLDGNFGWMQSFTDYFVSVDVDILVEHEDERPPYYDFSSPHLNGLSGSQARQRANDLLILFNGTMRANFGADFYNFTIGEGRDLLRRGPIVATTGKRSRCWRSQMMSRTCVITDPIEN